MLTYWRGRLTSSYVITIQESAGRHRRPLSLRDPFDLELDAPMDAALINDHDKDTYCW